MRCRGRLLSVAFQRCDPRLRRPRAERLSRSGQLEKVNGSAYIAGLVDGVPRATNVECYARIVKEKAGLLALIDELARRWPRHMQPSSASQRRPPLRGFIDRIIVPPGDELLRVVGNLGEMLTAAGAPREAAAVGNVGCGGSPWTTSAPLLDGSVNTHFPLFSTEVFDVRRTLG